MTEYKLKPTPLTQSAFMDFGDVIEINTHKEIKSINQGITDRYHDMADLDVLQNNGKVLFNLFRSKPIKLPFKVNLMERHPLSSQLFYPLSELPFFVLVSKSVNDPSPESLELFVTNGRQGINYKRNIWHHYLLATSKQSDFIVVDRGGKEKNCDEFYFQENIFIMA